MYTIIYLLVVVMFCSAGGILFISKSRGPNLKKRVKQTWLVLGNIFFIIFNIGCCYVLFSGGYLIHFKIAGSKIKKKG